MKIICFLLIILFSSQISGQSKKRIIDSLRQSFNINKNDTTQVRLYSWLANEERLQNPELYIKYRDSQLSVLKKMNWTKGYAVYYNDLGTFYSYQSDNLKAAEYAYKSLEYSEHFPQIRSFTLGNLSRLYIIQENDSLAKSYNEQLLSLIKKNDLKYNWSTYYNNAGAIEKDTLKKQEIFRRSIEIYIKYEQNSDLATAYMKLAKVLKDPNEKIKYFNMSKKIFDSIAPNYVDATRNALGLSKEYLFLATHDSIRKASKIRQDKFQLLKLAETYILENIEICKKSGGSQTLYESYGVLSSIKRELGDYREALKYSEMYHTSLDSLFSQETKNKIAKQESQKELQLKDKEIQLKNIKLEVQKKQKWLYLGGIGLLVIIGGLLFYQSSLRRKTNKKLSLLNTELDQANKNKTRFFSILNHDLRSPVANLIHFLHLQKNNPELMDLETKNRLENNTISGAENLLSSMEDILLWSKGQMENFKPLPKPVMVNELFTDNKKVFSGYVNITFQYDNPENLEILTDKDYVKTIIRNLTSNAINVFINTQNPKIIWKAWKDENRTILSITDNGPGATAEKFNALYDETQVVGIKSGLGLHLIRDLAKAIDCKIEVQTDSDNGTTVILKFN